MVEPRAVAPHNRNPTRADKVRMRGNLERSGAFGAIIGDDPGLRATLARTALVAPTGTPVLVTGESGTGKELLARALHELGPNPSGPFVAVNCGALPRELAESELFGHERGAFTGAASRRAGWFEEASGGTLVLDEIGELPLDLQPKLLRFLERREVKPVGGDAWHKLDVRVVAATHRDLSALVADGRFREDLFHRLTVLTVRVPPLRERLDDVPGLVDRLLAQMGRPASTLAPKTRSLLKAHRWPGNVRELRNVVMKATHLGESDLGEEADTSLSGAERFHAAKERLITAFEVDYLKTLITHASGNVSRAARESGLDRVHLHRLLKKHNLDSK
jgi:DNA-binding NtrC family response regulator